jgi:hypothetical protein
MTYLSLDVDGHLPYQTSVSRSTVDAVEQDLELVTAQLPTAH